MAGDVLTDPHGVDGEAKGLGVVAAGYRICPDKTVRRTRSRFLTLQGPWAQLSGCEVTGYTTMVILMR